MSCLAKIFLALLICAFCAFDAQAAEKLEPVHGVWKAGDFKFHTGETLKDFNIGYTTLGNPKGEPVLILHGTNGSGRRMLAEPFASQLFGPGQPLDASKYYIIMPDAIGTGQSTKPSNGLRAKFPRYNYDDMVNAQYRLLTEGLGIKHLRLILGHSMGGMQTWLWGIEHPDFMDALVPMASTPGPMSGRNWITRRFISESIRRDPAWEGGNYKEQPKSAQFATAFYDLATNNGNMALQKKAPTSAKGNEIVSSRIDSPYKSDANDVLYQWESSESYNPANLEAIKAPVLVINSADDERNPPELGIMEKALARIPAKTRLYMIPASEDTVGHGTTFHSKWWAPELAKFMKETEKK